MDIFAQIVEKIVREQEKIIGPIALEQARKVQGLSVDMQKNEVKFTGSQKEIIESLIEQYKHLFGQASVEVCRDAAKNFISKMSKDQIPSQLQ